MHDNDSDTGLLVQNQLGQQWLCYGKYIRILVTEPSLPRTGDKQFKESWDIVNRARMYGSCLMR